MDIWSAVHILMAWCLSIRASEVQKIFSCQKTMVCFQLYLKPLSHSTAIPRRWHGDLKFLRALWDRTKILENIANNFTFSITWRCHGAPTATVAFPRSAHGVPPRSHGVLTGDWLHGHRALMARSWHAMSCHCASTACTQHARCAQSCVSTSVNEHITKSAPGILQNSSCIWTGLE